MFHHAIWITLSAIFLAASLWWISFIRTRYWLLGSKIPGPRSVPLLGNILSFTGNSSILQMVSSGARKYGTVFRYWLGPHLLVCLTDPKDVEIILNSSKCVSKSFLYDSMQYVWGCSIISARTEQWRKHRKIMNPTFRIKVLEDFIATFYDKSRILVGGLWKHANTEPFDILDHMLKFTLDSVTQTSLGTDMNIQTQNNDEIFRSISALKEIAQHFMLKFWYWIKAMREVIIFVCHYDKLKKPFQDMAEKIIKRKLKHYSMNNCASESKYERNCKGFIDHILDAMFQGEILMTISEIQDQALGLLLAGTDTTALTVSAALMLLGLHQDVQRNVVEELQGIFSSEICRPVCPYDLRRMTYLEQVIKETLRLFPVVPFISRQILNETELTTYTLPANTTVVIPIILLHRNPATFTDPGHFIPARFDSRSQNHHPFSFIPFSAGPRNCIGKAYAYMQMKTVLSAILRNFEVLPNGSMEEMENNDFQVLLSFKNGYKIRLSPRNIY